MNMSKKTKKTKRKKINTKRKGKGLTSNFKKIKEHIKNINFDDKDIPEDAVLLITEYYAKNLINSRVNELKKKKKLKKKLLKKLDKYQDILNLIHSYISPQDLSDEYDFISNSGYGTIKHLEALDKYSYTPIHRITFKPISTNFK